MKAIKHTNIKTLTVLASLLLLTVSLAIPVQESNAEKEEKEKNSDGEKEKNSDGMKQINECSDSTCINIICVAGEMCIIPPLNDPFRLPI